MNEKCCCVVDEKGFYLAYVLVQTNGNKQTVVGYTLQAGEVLVDSETTPDRKQHAGSTGFVKPRWDEDIKTWVEGATAEELAAWEAEHPAPAVDLDVEKARRIQQSNDDLADYLLAHPLLWTDGNYYSITEKKQNQLTRAFALYDIDTALGKNPKLMWNDTGEVCREWTREELALLASAIGERVRPLVEYQQSKEVAIREAETLQALDAIEVDYGSVE